MEKIKVRNDEYEIVSIDQRGNLLEIVFPSPVDLTGKNISKIEVFTEGGILCAILTGFTTIYAVDGAKVILSKNGRTQPVDTPSEPEPEPNPGQTGSDDQEDPMPSEIDLKLQEFDEELTNLSNAIVIMSMMSV